MDPITIIVGVGTGIAAAVAFGASAVQIWEFSQKRLQRTSEKPKALPKPVTGKAGLRVSSAPDVYVELLNSLEWPRLRDEVLLDARGGEIILVRTPFGGIRQLFADVTLRTVFAKKRAANSVQSATDMAEKTVLRGNSVLVAQATSAADAEALLISLSEAQSSRSRRLRRRLKSKFVIVFAPMGASIAHPPTINVREVRHSSLASCATSGLRVSLTGSDDTFAFERECRSWANSAPLFGSNPAKASASVIRRFLGSWTHELEVAQTNCGVDEAIAFFMASIAIGMQEIPASLERAISNPSIRGLYEEYLEALSLAESSGGLAGISCKIAARRFFRLLRTCGPEDREILLRATPIGCGDLPPWIRLICIEAAQLEFDEIAQSDLMVQLSGILENSDQAHSNFDFLGSNILFLGAIGRRHAIPDLKSTPLLWPNFDQRTYQGYRFDGCRILKPSLPESFGPVSALCWVGADLFAFGTFTGELRILRISSGEIVYSERIDQNAISGLALSPKENSLLAVAYSGTVHRIDTSQMSRIGDPLATPSRCRGIVFSCQLDAFLLINEAGELVQVSHDLSHYSIVWQTPDKARLKTVCLVGKSEVCIGLDTGEVAMFNIRSESARKLLMGEAPIRCVSWSAESQRLAVVSDDGVLRMCDRDGRDIQQVRVSEEKLWSVAFLNSSREIVVGGNTGSLRFLDARTLIETRFADIHGSWIRCLLPTASEDIIWSGGEDQTLCEFNVHKMTLDSRRVGAAPRIFALRDFRGEAYVVGAGDGVLYSISADEPDKVRWTGVGHSDQIWCVHVCANLDLVISGSDDRKVALWRLSDGGLIGHMECGQGWIGAVCLDEAARSALAGDDNGYLYQFDVVSKRRVSVNRISNRRISAIIGLGDSVHLAATEAGEVIGLSIDASGVKVLWVRQVGRGPLYSLAELADGRIVAGGSDGAVYFFEAKAKSRSSRRKVSSGPIWNVSVAHHSSDQCAIFCSDAGELGLVSAKRHEIIYKRSSPIWSCVGAQDGKIAFGGEDGEILILESVSRNLKTHHLPRSFSAASFEDVSGLTATEMSVMAAAGARFT